ncbi:hypothetical protein GZH53_19345 [Flavihumibacter sp. R14]|nr:hypothetical protein [Flavihumibacter soli]
MDKLRIPGKFTIFKINMTTPSTYWRPAFNWLLSVILLTGIFSFSGYSGNSQIFTSRPFQTELVFTGNPGQTKRAVSLPRTLVSTRSKASPTNFDQVSAALNYNRRIKMEFDNLSEQFRFINTTFSFCAAQRTPHKSDEDDSFLMAV